jgi:methyl-accepting chemotaxis protein
MSDENEPSASVDPVRMLRDVLDRVSETSRAVLSASARHTPGVVGGPVADYLDAVTSLTEKLTGPLEQLLAEQQRVAARMAEWAERNQQLADEMATLARQHRQLSEQVQRLVRPALEQVDRMSETTRAYVDELRR